MARPDIAGGEFLAAYALTGRAGKDFITAAQQARRYKYGMGEEQGSKDAANFYEALFEGLRVYPWLQTSLAGWAANAAQRIQSDYRQVHQAVCQWPLHEAE